MNSTFFCFGLPAIVIVALLAMRYLVDAQRKKTIHQASLDYQEALTALQRQPTNADLKQRALQLGRYYANLTRQQRGVTVFDEMALMNDLNAATAGAPIHAHGGTIEDRLQRLAELRSQGLVDESEYIAQRTQILNSI